MNNNQLFLSKCLSKAALNGENTYVKNLVEVDKVEIYDHPAFMIAFQAGFLNIAKYLYEKGVNYEFVKSLARTNLANEYSDAQILLLLENFNVNANLLPYRVLMKSFERRDMNIINLLVRNFLDKEVLEKLCIKFNVVLELKQY